MNSSNYSEIKRSIKIRQKLKKLGFTAQGRTLVQGNLSWRLDLSKNTNNYCSFNKIEIEEAFSSIHISISPGNEVFITNYVWVDFDEFLNKDFNELLLEYFL